MKTTTFFALVAAATLGYASPAEQAEAAEAGGYVAAPSYEDDSWGKGGGGGGASYWGSSDPSWGSPGGSRHGSAKWGGGGGGGGWGKGYGPCHTCDPIPHGIPHPPHGHPGWYPDTFHPSNPFKKNFNKIANKCSSVNNVGTGDQAAGCCNKVGTSDGDQNDNSGGSGLLGLGGILNGVLSGGATCTLDIASSLCSSGSVACCPVKDSGNGFSLVNVQGVCAPITL